MSTGAMVVGIIGGVAGLIMGVIVWTIASFVNDLMGFIGLDGSWVILLGTLVLAASVAGMVGGALVKAKPLHGGILMLIGGLGGFALLERFWLFPGILLIIGGVMALWVFRSQRNLAQFEDEPVLPHAPLHPATWESPRQPANYGPRDAMTAGAAYPAGRLTVRAGPQAGQSFSISGETITIGRSSDNTVVLTEPTVSRHHARISRQGSAYFIEDMGSTSGSMLNGTRLQRPERLTPGSVIRLGSAELAYDASEVARTGATQFPGQPGAGGATAVLGGAKGTAWLLVEKGAQAGQSFVLQGNNITIGRSPSSTIRLEDSMVSRDHALIRRIDRQYVLFDMGSHGGIRVNGQTTGTGGHRIREGSRVLLGSCEMALSIVEGGLPAPSDGTVLLRQERRGALLVRSGPAAGQSIPLTDDLVIGREPGPGGAVLNDPSVSRRHAVIRITQDGHVIYDLGSANGTTVDGVKLSGRPLLNGDTVEVGATLLKFGQS